jgi:hypothetical protein
MDTKASPEQALTLTCHWSRNASTGRLEANWRLEAPAKRQDAIRPFAQKA